MKKHLYCLTVILICAVISSASMAAVLKATTSVAPPVELEKGWNLISTPCDIETSALVKGNQAGPKEASKNDKSESDGSSSVNDASADNGKSGDNGKDNGNGNGADNGNAGGENATEAGNSDKSDAGSGNGKDKETTFYEWNGEGYEEVTFLRRGVGYIVNTNNIQNTSSVCGGNVVEPMEITLKEGWNLVGNPYHKSYKVEDIFGSAYSSIEVIYEYSGNKYSELKSSEHFKPWRGYWVYVAKDVEIPVFISCELSIKASSESIGVGETSDLEATYSCKSSTGEVESYDVSEDAGWNNANPDAGTIEKGQFTGTAVGAAEITAAYKELGSNAVTITVTDGSECDKVVVAQVYDEEANEEGFCGNYSYLRGGSLYVGSQYVSLVGEQCRKCGDGDVVCRTNAMYDTAESLPVLWHEPNKEIPLKAYCVKTEEAQGDETTGYVTKEVSYSEYRDVTDESEMLVRNSRSFVSAIGEEGLSMPTTDYALVYAKYDDIVGDYGKVLVFDSERVVNMYFQQASLDMAPNQKRENRLMGTFLDLDAECAASASNNTVCSYMRTEDITDRADISPINDFISYEKGVVSSWSRVGYSQVTAKYQGKSVSMNVRIVDPEELLGVYFDPGYVDVFIGESAPARLYGMYPSVGENCASELEKIYSCRYRFEDVTDKGTYQYKNSLIKYENGVVTAYYKTGSTTIYAEFEGKYDYLPVEVISDELILITIFGPKKNKMPECPTSGCYATFVDEPINLQVFAFSTDFTSMLEITDKVTWETGDSSIATIDAAGKLTPAKGGTLWVRATYKDARSDKAWIAISDKETERFLIAGTGSTRLRPLQTGKSMNVYSAIYEVNRVFTYSPVKFIGYVNADGYVETDDSLTTTSVVKNCWGYTECLKVTGDEPGFAGLYTKYEGLESNVLEFEVWRYESMSRCDASKPNTMVWSDSWGAQAVLDTDCYSYKQDDDVQVRYTAKIAGGTEMFFDNCLDLWILDENDNIVKTFRNEGCSTESIGRNAHKTVETVFQVAYDWDQVGDDGKKVAPGKYYATARFYILYEPVIHLPFEIK